MGPKVRVDRRTKPKENIDEINRQLLAKLEDREVEILHLKAELRETSGLLRLALDMLKLPTKGTE